MRFFISFFLINFLTFNVWAQSFLPQTEDIPQMPGIQNIEEVADFDNPDERLVILTANSSKPISEIQKFYETNLKNLGWTKTKANTFQRGKETFQIEMKRVKKMTQIQFVLTQE